MVFHMILICISRRLLLLTSFHVLISHSYTLFNDLSIQFICSLLIVLFFIILYTGSLYTGSLYILDTNCSGKIEFSFSYTNN